MQNTIWIDLEGLVLTPQDKKRLKHPWTGGVILFARNFSHREQLQELTAAVRSVRQDLPIAVDHEGGRVQRFHQGFTRIPAMATLGQLYDLNPESAIHQAYQYGRTIASELKSAGVDVTFAPVLDLDFARSTVIGNRAFHATAEGVIALANGFIEGLHLEGMWAIGKHFPGHGYVQADSHTHDPVDERELPALWEMDLKPYQALVDKLDAIMTAHVLFPAIDPELVTYSPFWLKNILREQIQFKGKIFSDDLVMHAAAHLPVQERIARAMAAGCDYTLICNSPDTVDALYFSKTASQRESV